MSVKIGSRKSHLAQVQAKKVNELFLKANEGVKTELYFRPSFGDLNLDVNLSTTDQKGVFTSDFLELLKSNECDMVVHSWKDLPIDENAFTSLVGTLEREDTRDLFLIKKPSLKNKKWNILTSSPRREFNLKSFFDFVSEENQELSFSPIRGNIPTRFKKFLEDDNADGFCVAYAAVKRLKDCSDFNDENPGLWGVLNEACQWCLLPESYCPSAAAQGALAIEVLTENKELTAAVQKINHPHVFKDVQKERRILKAHGGGCHLAVGATVISHKEGELVFESGHIKDKTFRCVTFHPNALTYPDKVERSKVWVSSESVKAKRDQLNVELNSKGKKAFVVTKKASFQKDFFNAESDVLFSSGIKTWKKLFKDGHWVNGCLDSLGESQFEPDVLDAGFEKIWLTREGVPSPNGFKSVASYSLKTNLNLESFKDKDYFIWMSGELLLESLKRFPELYDKKHFIGLGRSLEKVRKVENESLLSSKLELYPFYTLDQVLKKISK